MIAPIRSFAVLIIAASALVACAGSSSYENDPIYKEAYDAGCMTAASYIPGDRSTLSRDPELYKSNKAYKAGWRAGYGACKDHPQRDMPGMPDYNTGRRNGPSGY